MAIKILSPKTLAQAIDSTGYCQDRAKLQEAGKYPPEYCVGAHKGYPQDKLYKRND